MPFDNGRNRTQQFGFNPNFPSSSSHHYKESHNQSSQEEEFSFVHNLTFENTQVKKGRNGLSFQPSVPKNNFNQIRQNFNPHITKNNFMMNSPESPESFLNKSQSYGNFNCSFNQFSNQNHQQANFFNSNPKYQNTPLKNNFQNPNP